MQCRKCSQTKMPADFAPAMVTMPAVGLICVSCQDEVAQQINRLRKGFFKCRVCFKIFPSEVAIGKDRGQTCPNCASRDTDNREKGLQTCHRKTCKRKFADGWAQDGKRHRYCPDCRRY